MTAFLRPASAALDTALANGSIRYWAELFTITLVDGATVLNWTNFDRPLKASGVEFTAQSAFLSRSSWKISNSMQVPSLTLKASSLNAGFNGGSTLQDQIHDGLLDGATFLLESAFMGDDVNPDTLGAMPLFAGKIAGIDLDGVTASIGVKGKVNDLDQYAPRNLYQVPCNHSFCDTGCTLSKATFTASYAIGADPSTILLPWATAPTKAANYQNGTLVMTSGAASGSRRTIAKASADGLQLSYPLPFLPAAGDQFTALEGCDKTRDSGSPQSCSARSNTQHYRGFPFTPPPASAY